MHRGNKFLASLMVSAALMAPLGVQAMTAAQDDHEKHEQEEHERKVYDAEHKDYHNWDKREDEAYRRWLETKHQAYVDYERLDEKMQHEYWKWRHEHDDRR